VRCRHCESELALPLIDLGSMPPSNAYLEAADLSRPEPAYPLRVKVCTRCWLAQTEDYAGATELFHAGYAYFSSYSSTWLAHARAYVEAMSERFALGPGSRVVEIAANDGYLLQYVAARGISCYGVEPTAATAAAARAHGIEIVQDFFGTRLARQLAGQGRRADLMVANNVLAHVPDINDFAAGFATLLQPDGVATFEFPHLLELIDHAQFDTIYHEHYSYLSLHAVEQVFARAGLRTFDVERIATHGGSLRVFAERSDTGRRPAGERVVALRALEAVRGVTSTAYYGSLQGRAERLRDAFVAFLDQARRRGETVAAYGAAAKGNTLLNFAGIHADRVPFVVDRNPAKQGRYLPGSHIPIVDESVLRARRPHWVLILPWNLRKEIVQQLAYAREWGAGFVTAVPELRARPEP
jgi:SAM-dependent methyltransferase